MGSRIDRLLGERHVHHRDTWTSALARDALLTEITHRLTLLGGAPASDGRSGLEARTGSYLATAWLANARWPMQWSVQVDDADRPAITVDVVDALPPHVRPGSQRLYRRAMRKATNDLRRGLAEEDPH